MGKTFIHTDPEGRRFFVKWEDDPPPGFFEAEARGLELLRRAGGDLVIPEVLGLGSCTAGLPALQGRPESRLPPFSRLPAARFICLEYLEARPSTPAEEERFGRALAALHRKTRDRFGLGRSGTEDRRKDKAGIGAGPAPDPDPDPGEGGDNFCGPTPQKNRPHARWADFYREERILPLLRLIEKRRGLETETRRRFERLLARLPALLAHAPGPALTHGDLWAGNFMVTPRGPALFDPAAHYADREMDLAMMRLFGGFPARVFAAYEEAHPLPPGHGERTALCQIYPVLNHFYLFGGSYLGRALSLASKYD